ncbi:MAG: mechanosensitive ion channel [Lentisphaeria bacterium]|nr:mechanosensitive ion channel [Lentisphaeria bacterium]
MRNFSEELKELVIRSNLPGIIGAAIVLLIGWFIALWVSELASKAAIGCSKWRKYLPGANEENDLDSAGKMAGRISYWIVMIMVLLGCMSLLHLEYAAIPLKEFLIIVAKYLPNIAGALLLVVIARITAGIVRAGVRKIMQHTLAGKVDEKKWGIEYTRNSEISVQAAGFIVYLFFLPAILDALKIYGITAPLQAMFAVALIYLPRVAAALAILLIGLWAAKVIYRGVNAGLNAMKLDDAGKFFGFKEFSGEKFSRLCGYTAWTLVAIPVVIAALTALDIAALTQSVSGFLNILLAGAGNIVGAVLILFGTYLIGKVAEKAVSRVSSAAGLDNFWKKLGVGNEYFPEFTLSEAAGKISMIAVWILGSVAACEILHFTQLSGIIRKFAYFGGNLIISVIVILIGISLARFAGRLAGEKAGKTLNYVIQAAVMIFAFSLALSNLKIGQAVVEITIAMILGALCLAGGLAFGLGGREFAAGLLERWQRDKQNR